MLNEKSCQRKTIQLLVDHYFYSRCTILLVQRLQCLNFVVFLDAGDSTKTFMELFRRQKPLLIKVTEITTVFRKVTSESSTLIEFCANIETRMHRLPAQLVGERPLFLSALLVFVCCTKSRIKIFKTIDQPADSLCKNSLA